MSREKIIAAIQDALEAWRHLPLDMLTQRIVDRVGDASADELVAAALHVMCSQARAIHTYRCYQMDIGLNISSAEIATLIDEALVTEVQAPGLIACRVLERVYGVQHIALAVACLQLLINGNVELAARCRQMQEENERRVAGPSRPSRPSRP